MTLVALLADVIALCLGVYAGWMACEARDAAVRAEAALKTMRALLDEQRRLVAELRELRRSR